MAESNSKSLVTVEWKGYCSALLRGIWKIFNDQRFVDVNLTCHHQDLKVHKLILAEFFQGLKDSLPRTAGDGLAAEAGHSGNQVCLDHLSKDKQDADVLRYLIEFAYSGKVALPENRLKSVLDAAEVVGFKQLAQSIRDKLGIRVVPDGHADVTSSSSSSSSSSSESSVKHDNANSAPAKADSAVAPAPAKPKRSSRKGIPMKLVKTPARRPGKNNAAVTGRQVSSKCKQAPVETARTARLRMRNRKRDVPPVGSDDGDSGDSGNDGGSGTDPTSSDSCSEDEDWAEVVQKARGRKPRKVITPKQNADGSRLKNAKPCSTTAAQKAEAPAEDKPRPKRIRIRVRPTLKCERCEYTSTSKPRFDAHCAKHDRPVVEKVYECELCSRAFKSNRSLKEHMAFHNPELQHKCKMCSFVTNLKWSFRHHLAVKHFVDEDGNPMAKKFECPDCGYVSVTNRQLRTHILIKHPTNLHRCKFCDYADSRPFRVKNHMAVVHNIDNAGKSIDRDVRCKECSYTCFTERQMAYHVVRRHKPDKRKMCDECGYTTAFTAELQRHVKLVHRGECNYVCDSCGMRIKTFSGLERHKRTHLGLKPFKCTLCPKAFLEKHNLKAHMERHERPKNPKSSSKKNNSSTAGSMAANRVSASNPQDAPTLSLADNAHMFIDRPSSDSSGHLQHHHHLTAEKEDDEEQRVAIEGIVGPPASVVRFVGQGGSAECFGGLRLSVDRFEGLVDCGGLFQDL